MISFDPPARLVIGLGLVIVLATCGKARESAHQPEAPSSEVPAEAVTVPAKADPTPVAAPELAPAPPPIVVDAAPKAPPTSEPPAPATPAPSCLASRLSQWTGRSHLMLGAMTSDAIAASNPLDARYIYLSGGVGDGSAPCSSCAQGCSAQGESCSGGACDWWGCWQSDSAPPGEYLRTFLAHTAQRGQLPVITYYELLQTAGTAEGAAEVAALKDVALMKRYYADWRFVLQTIGASKTLLHLEPDLWGYAQQTGQPPSEIAAAVASANPTDCPDLPNTVAGFGKCLIRMTRTYAPNATVGLHASAWATSIDVMQNDSAALDVAAAARTTAAFLRAAGATDGDFIVVEASDRDAAFYAAQGQQRWWDETNATLPNFHQALKWVKTLSEELALPNLWWQLPVGHAEMSDGALAYSDNRLDYFLSHPQEVIDAHGFALLFGAGEKTQTNPSTDGGYFIARSAGYFAATSPLVCSVR